jgi:hypothetical protein
LLSNIVLLLLIILDLLFAAISDIFPTEAADASDAAGSMPLLLLDPIKFELLLI